MITTEGGALRLFNPPPTGGGMITTEGGALRLFNPPPTGGARGGRNNQQEGFLLGQASLRAERGDITTTSISEPLLSNIIYRKNCSRPVSGQATVVI